MARIANITRVERLARMQELRAERAGFELLAPLRRDGASQDHPDRFRPFFFREKSRLFRERDREFESVFLQRRVRCEPRPGWSFALMRQRRRPQLLRSSSPGRWTRLRGLRVCGSVAKDEYVRGVQAELLAPPRTRGVLLVAERKIVYLRNVRRGSSGLEDEACRTLAMPSQRRSGTAPR
jgi:hypothetical protein